MITAAYREESHMTNQSNAHYFVRTVKPFMRAEPSRSPAFFPVTWGLHFNIGICRSTDIQTEACTVEKIFSKENVKICSLLKKIPAKRWLNS